LTLCGCGAGCCCCCCGAAGGPCARACSDRSLARRSSASCDVARRGDSGAARTGERGPVGEPSPIDDDDDALYLGDSRSGAGGVALAGGGPTYRGVCCLPGLAGAEPGGEKVAKAVEEPARARFADEGGGGET